VLSATRVAIDEHGGSDEHDAHVLHTIRSLDIRDALVAWQELKPTLGRLARAVAARRVLEIGGGRDPLFSPEEAGQLGFDLTVNDIDREELALLPSGFQKAVFDIAGPTDEIPLGACEFDLVYSKMVFEHVHDAKQAWANVHHLLARGGVGFAFVPTLYSLPFVINRYCPEWMTSRLLRWIDPKRNNLEVPKFPAYYNWCRASESILRPTLLSVGFREATVLPFFGTPYLPGVPLLKGVTAAFDRMAARSDWRIFASYAYIIVIK
jgi:SAM-dependent methyltransferase